jgi:hypothetical protein
LSQGCIDGSSQTEPVARPRLGDKRREPVPRPPVLVGRSGRRIHADLLRKYREIKKQLRQAQVVVAGSLGLVLLLVVLMGGWSFGDDLARQSLRQLLNERNAEIRRMDALLHRAHVEIERLVSERVPGLLPLELGRTVRVVGSPVRSVTLTALPGGVAEGSEYRIVMESDAEEAVPIDLSLALFDRLGVELERFELGGAVLASRLPSGGGLSGRSLSQSGTLRSSRVGEARFFRLEVGGP